MAFCSYCLALPGGAGRLRWPHTRTRKATSLSFWRAQLNIITPVFIPLWSSVTARSKPSMNPCIGFYDDEGKDQGQSAKWCHLGRGGA